MKFLLLAAGAVFLGRAAMAQDSQLPVPCEKISPQAVTAVPPPFDAYMKLFCFEKSGQGLMPVGGAAWLDGNNSEALSAMKVEIGPDGQPHFSTAWYVSLTAKQISPADDAKLRKVLSGDMKPLFINGARIIELDAATSAGEVKQEFIVTPADVVATHGIQLLVECFEFCQGDDRPWILAIVPKGYH